MLRIRQKGFDRVASHIRRECHSIGMILLEGSPRISFSRVTNIAKLAIQDDGDVIRNGAHDALQRAASADRAKLTAALASSTFSGHLMPYGPTKFVNGQNEGAAPVNTQVLDNDIKVVLPSAFANAKPVFPRPA